MMSEAVSSFMNTDEFAVTALLESERETVPLIGIVSQSSDPYNSGNVTFQARDITFSFFNESNLDIHTYNRLTLAEIPYTIQKHRLTDDGLTHCDCVEVDE